MKDPSDDRPPGALQSRRRTRLLGLLVLNGIGQAAAAGGVALVTERAFNRLVAGAPALGVTALAPLVAGLVIAAALAAWLRARERLDAERLGQDYVHDVRLVCYDRLVTLSHRATARRSQGGMAQRFTGDLTALRQWASLGLARLVVAGTAVGGAIAMLCALSMAIGLAVGGVLVCGALASLLLGRPLRRAALRASRRRTRLAANVTEQAGAIAAVQALGQTARERERVAHQSRELGDAMVVRARAVGVQRGLAEACAVLAAAAAMAAGALEVAAQRASPATVVAAIAVVGLLAPMLRDLGRVPEYWHSSRVALDRVRALLSERDRVVDQPAAPQLAPGPGRLAFEDVRLEGSIDRATAVAEPGQVVAIVGPNGAGKSSLLALAARLVQPDSGRLTLDGQDLAYVRLDSLRAAVSIAGPELPLLRGTVERNLRYRDPEVSAGQLAGVLRLTGLDRVLERLPEGADTRLRDRGRPLSSGERARLALARALVGHPRVLLLDEVEANLDGAGADAVLRVVESLRGEVTILLVTHRPELAARADTVWHMERGCLSMAASAPRSVARGAKGNHERDLMSFSFSLQPERAA